MFSKYQFEIAAAVLSSSFFCSTAYAINAASLLKGVSEDVTIVREDGSCDANPYLKDEPCLATRATCPTGKIPVGIKKGSECTSSVKNVEFEASHSNTYSAGTQTATGYVECNPRSKGYYDSSTQQYFPSLPGYSPLCKGNDCKTFNYQVIARCITAPPKSVLDKLGIKY